MRVFYIEPFLRRSESHYVEHTLAIYSYLKIRQDIELQVIGHRELNQDIMKLFPEVQPAITQTGFEDLDNRGQSFYADLITLDRQFLFVPDDLIIIPTAYENEIIGTSLLAQYLSNRCPMISMQFHQLFPPVSQSNMNYSSTFRRYWVNRLCDAFNFSHIPQISYWTTESHALNLAYRRLSRAEVKVLPVPFVLDDALPVKAQPTVDKGLRIGFVGDGRQEKGLLHFLRVCELLAESKGSFGYVLQLNNPRGFSHAEQQQLNHALERFEALPNAELIRGGLHPTEHHALINSLNIILLPYNPSNYSRRVSGIFIQAAIQQCVIIVSEGTWAATALRRKRAAGLSFNYITEDANATAANIAKTIWQIFEDHPRFILEAISRSAYYRSYCHASNYIGTLLEHYGRV